MHRAVRIGIFSLVFAVPCVSTAFAQRFDKVVAFGDSYADIGNARAILTSEGLGAFFDSAKLPTGRFSGGTNFVDTIASIYRVPDENFAVGGAQSGATNVATSFLPGFEQQWSAFTQGGKAFVSGAQITIPQGGYHFRPNDLGVFSVGGNDSLGYSENGTLAGVVAAAAESTANATEGLDALVGRGLKHMVYIVGDLGLVPEFRSTPSGPVATAFSDTFNSDIQTSLARYAAAGVQVAYVDITQINFSLRANLARFGFTDVVDACPAACVGNTALQNQYFFFVDGLHLTSAGFAMVGKYAVNQINAPYGFKATGDLPRLAAEDFGQQMVGRLDQSRSRPVPDGLSVFASFTGAEAHQDADATGNAYEYGSQGGIGGAEYGRGPITLGGLFSYVDGHVNGVAQDRADAHSYQLGGYAALDKAHFFARAYAGHGWHDVNVRRTGVIYDLAADPGAQSWSTGGRVGYLLGDGPLQIGPTLGLDYAWARVNGYREVNDPAADLSVSGQGSTTLFGSAGAEARFSGFGRFRPWVRVSAEKDLAGAGRNVTYAPTVAASIVNSFTIGDGSRSVYGALTGGILAAVYGPVSLELDGQTTFFKSNGNQAAGVIEVNVRI